MPKIALSVESITTKDGATHKLPSKGVTLIVGPNNVGKSLTLREISHLVTDRSGGVVNSLLSLAKIKTSIDGSADDLIGWLKDHGARYHRDYEDREWLTLAGSDRVDLNKIRRLWEANSGFQQLSAVLMAAQMADSRLHLTGNTTVHNQMVESQAHPLQSMFMEAELEERLSKLTKRAFGFEISLNRYVQQLELRIGKPSLPLTPPPASQALLEEFQSLPQVSAQGDGVRAFVGLVLYVLLSASPLMVIDEPEAFLHPPQARLLGRMLVADSPKDRQLIVATHSSDILQGVLDSRAREVKVIRVDRAEGVTSLRGTRGNICSLALVGPAAPVLEPLRRHISPGCDHLRR